MSPLAEIEAAVHERAKALVADPSDSESVRQISQLVDNEIERWNLDHKRGFRDHDLADPQTVSERVRRNLLGYGPLEPLLLDDDVWEIMVNAPDEVFVKRHKGLNGYHDEVFHDDDHVRRTLTKILDDSTTSHRTLDPTDGLQDAQLDDGSRLHIVHGDISRGGHLMFNIRKFSRVGYRSLVELVEAGSLGHTAAAFLRACVQARLSIVFAGSPGSGKTTMLSCCAAELDPTLRVVTAEEVFEADIPLPNVASMQTRPARAERDVVDLRRLVAGFLRMAPDVAIVGEVRDREALPLLLTLSSGVTGYTTIHAGSARQALTRLRFICQLSDSANDLPIAALNTLVSEAVDVVVHLERSDSGVRLTSIAAVEDLVSGVESTQFTMTEVFGREQHETTAKWTGQFPVRATNAMRSHNIDIKEVLSVSRAANEREPLPR